MTIELTAFFQRILNHSVSKRNMAKDSTSNNILFLDIYNASVGQMAEAFARQEAGESIHVVSVGTTPSASLDPLAVDVMKSFGIDISNRKPKSMDELDVDRFHLGIKLCQFQEDQIPTLKGAPFFINWDLEDVNPAGSTTKKRKAMIMEKAERIRELVHDLFQFGYLNALLFQQSNLKSVMDAFSDAAIAHDLNRRIFYFNQGAEALTGLSQTDVIGKDCHEIFKPRLCGNECFFCEGLDAGRLVKEQYASFIYDTEGQRKEIDVTLIPAKAMNGAAYGAIASLRDTTQWKALERKTNVNKQFQGLIGVDDKMRELFEQIRNVAGYDYPVHIFGETGVGKELVASAIHNESDRRAGPFVPINCGALPEGLVESELFGHTKGSFSGAVRDKKGRFELADGGTLFLDEVSELPKQVQVKLLRFLQEGTLEKVGSVNKDMSVDVRIISATNKDLSQEIETGQFREDLYYRLNVIPLELHPLRYRKADIVPLCTYFLQQEALDHKQVPLEISQEAIQLLIDYEWPGNVRELQNAMRFAMVKSIGKVIQPVDLPAEVQALGPTSMVRGPGRKLSVDLVKGALVKSGGNKAKAARSLGVGRATLYRFLSEYPDVSDVKIAG